MLKNQQFVDPFLAQKIAKLESQMKKLIQTKMEINNNPRLKPQAKSQLLKFNQDHRLELRKVIEKCKMSMVQYFDKQLLVVSKECMMQGTVAAKSRDNLNYNELLASMESKRLQIFKQTYNEYDLKQKSYSIKSSKQSQSTNNKSFNDLSIKDRSRYCYDSYISSFNTNESKKETQFSAQNNPISLTKSCRSTHHARINSKQQGQIQSQIKSNKQLKSQAKRGGVSDNDDSLIEHWWINSQVQVRDVKEFNVTSKANKKDTHSNFIQQNKDQTHEHPMAKLKLTKLMSRQLVGDKNNQLINGQYKSAQTQNQECQQSSFQQQPNNFQEDSSCQEYQHIICLLKQKVDCLQRKCKGLQQKNQQLSSVLQFQEEIILQMQMELQLSRREYDRIQLKQSNQEKTWKILQEYYKSSLEQLQFKINEQKKQKNYHAKVGFIQNHHCSEQNCHLPVSLQKQCVHLKQLPSLMTNQLLSNHFLDVSSQQSLPESQILERTLQSYNEIKNEHQYLANISKQLISLQSKLRQIQEENQQLKVERKLLLKKVKISV